MFSTKQRRAIKKWFTFKIIYTTHWLLHSRNDPNILVHSMISIKYAYEHEHKYTHLPPAGANCPSNTLNAIYSNWHSELVVAYITIFMVNLVKSQLGGNIIM